MTGNIVNFFAVICGGIIGVLFKKFIKPSFSESINKALGIAVLIIGLNGIVCNMITVNDGNFQSNGELMLVVFLVLGTFLGEVLRLDDRLSGFSKKIEEKFKVSGFFAGFVNGTILFCVGAMAIIGSINDGLGDSSVLLVKSALDFTAAIIFGATLGWGVIFSAGPVLIYQGSIALLAVFLKDVLSGELLTQMCMSGYAIIMAIGFNFLITSKIKTLNMLPAVLLPVIYCVAMNIIK